jgi:Cu(I)/Ag(I) efflux system protein CusF
MTFRVGVQIMIRRNILMTLVAMAATSASSATALAWDAEQPNGRGLSAEVLSAGRVVRVDADAGKITVEHRPIWRLYMEAMTMVFKVRDATMLTGLTPGDRIRFKVERTGDGFVITRIENSNG